MKRVYLFLVLLITCAFNAQVVTLIDTYTKELVNYERVSNYYDGSLMNDSKTDHVIYRKKDGYYYKRQFDGNVSASWFGLKNDGVSDMSDVLNNFFAVAKKLKLKNLIIPEGKTYISKTVRVDVDNGTNVYFKNHFISNSLNESIIVGSDVENKEIHINGLSIIKKDYYGGILSGSVGITIKDLINSTINIKMTMGFDIGLLLNSTLGNGGISYNQFNFMTIWDNRIGVKFATTVPGYINENNFYGGSFNHSSAYPVNSAPNTYHVDMQTGTYLPNNNRFFSPSFEDNSLTAKAMRIDGNFNVVYTPRLENVKKVLDYPIEFVSTSAYNNIIGRGYGLTHQCITDLGNYNIYETIDGLRVQTANNHDVPVMTLQTVDGTNNNIFRVLSKDKVNPTDVLNIDALGSIRSKGEFIVNEGIYFKAYSDNRDGWRGIYMGNGNPNTNNVKGGTGSIYLDLVSNSKSTLWIKKEGGGFSGFWSMIPTQAEIVPDTAVSATSSYNADQVNSIITELRQLKTSLQNSGVIK
ncbi:hypothetical protein [Chryseobacterium defluvii]|uniref:Pectate lyase-like protein n=1 Tax=Chryseobacterium defluvii TaxID=160396 RepID=A0A495SDB7_9FLAO|nr:hypothetical protein [Chryseobacterium defluvii]RKS98230.1 hypothetical protein BCF58_2371 [Chryseobacterium defluvii]